MTARTGPAGSPSGDLQPGPTPSGAGQPVELRRSRRSRTPYAVLEVLRLLAVVFFAGAGYQIGATIDPDRPVLGALNGTAVGLILGSGLGYVLGGILGRKAGATAEVART